MSTFIELTRGLVAYVDAEDRARFGHLAWFAQRAVHTWYAARTVRLPSGGRRKIYLHREIIEAVAGEKVDHEDGDGLNCRRRNLRVCTHSQNLANMRPRADGRYRGVAANGPSWTAQLTVKGRYVYGGVYPTAEEAARARDRLALEHFGAFARLNFPAEEGALL